MAKKGKKRRRQQRKKRLLLAGGIVLVGAVAAAGVLGYKYKTRETREDVLTEYMECIEKGEYAKMYGLLDEDSKAGVSEEEFTARNKNIYEGIEVRDLKVKIPKEQAKDQPISYSVSMQTLAGEISYDNDTFLVKEDKKWRIVWEDSMIFPGLGKEDKVGVQTLAAERGSIFDRYGNLLAGKGKVQSIGLVPGKMEEEPKEEIEEIAEVLGMTAEDISGNLSAGWVTDESFVPLKKMTKRQLEEPAVSAEEIPTGESKSIKERLLSYPGILISDAESRVYPYGESASHLLGYVQQINAEELEELKDKGYTQQSVVGKGGLEKLYEDRLRAQNGYKIFIKDAEGNEKEALAMQAAQNGEDITLTIDIQWQQKLYEAYKEDKSCSIVMNPKSGEVLALVSTPSFNSMDFALGMSQKKWDALNSDEKKPLFNRVRETWAPGSAFKPVIGAIGLSKGAFGADEDFGKSGSSWQKDSSWGNYKVTTLHEYNGAVLKNALIYSDNIYFAKAALKIGADAIAEEFEKIGFGQDIPFEIGMTKSRYANEDKIESEIQLADSGYGQGQILVNPLHLACMYSAFFNEGNMIVPYLELKEDHTPSYWIEGAFTTEAAKTLYEDLKEVVQNSDGTAHAAAKAAGGKLAGKTGTAEIKASQEDKNGTELGWFAVYNTNVSDEDTVLMLNMVEDVKGRGGSGYVVKKDVEVWNQMYR